MDYLREKVSYLKGLAEGLEIENTSKEGRLLNAIIDTLDDIALAVDDIIEVQEEFSDQLEDMDEDLREIETAVYDYDEDDDDTYITCPYCDEKIFVDDDVIEEDYVECPNCHNRVDIVWDCDCELHEVYDDDDNSE